MTVHRNALNSTAVIDGAVKPAVYEWCEIPVRALSLAARGTLQTVADQGVRRLTSPAFEAANAE